MPRSWIWTQLLIGWLPVWALFSVLLLVAHPGTRLAGAASIALRLVLAAAVLGLAVQRLAARWPWPHPFRLRFLGLHLLAAAIYAVAWLVLNSLFESLYRGQVAIALGPGPGPFLVMGVWLYVMVAGVAYANQAAQRAARAEALAARSQLAALRAQLDPHFLFNALHTVVQLIPLAPAAASRAAEHLAAVLRTAIEERRDLLPLADEWRFVQRYLDLEAIRFGERLRVRAQLYPAALPALLPSFALQALVENAVRHGAAPKVDPTTLEIRAWLEDGELRVQVEDNGHGGDPRALSNAAGSGLRRLRERLHWLYGGAASLALDGTPGRGWRALLRVPHQLETGDFGDG